MLVNRTEKQAARLKEILENYEVPVQEIVSGWERVSPGRGLTLCIGRLSKGFTWPDQGLYVISEDEVFGPKINRTRHKKTARPDALTWSSFSQLKAGDLGGARGARHRPLRRSRENGGPAEGQRFRDHRVLPTTTGCTSRRTRISNLQKYAGADDRNPKLDQLGGRSWNLAKQKATRSVKQIARQLVEIYALRKYRQGFAFSPPDHHFQEFEATFEHEETLDQIKAIEDVLTDMTGDRPMDRLICGDVGFGKTEVAVRAAFKAVSDGKQVALLVPTTVLAEQHFETFSKRMKEFSIRVGILSRFKTRAEQAETLAEVRSGRIDILVGTHRILQKDVSFRDLGLLIVDEEQRFGVKQKEQLKKYRSLVDVLAITATPVPRTLQMSMMGVRDLSIIETPPQDRLSIQTYLSPYDEALIARAVGVELDRKGQVFFRAQQGAGHRTRRATARAAGAPGPPGRGPRPDEGKGTGADHARVHQEGNRRPGLHDHHRIGGSISLRPTPSSSTRSIAWAWPRYTSCGDAWAGPRKRPTPTCC